MSASLLFTKRPFRKLLAVMIPQRNHLHLLSLHDPRRNMDVSWHNRFSSTAFAEAFSNPHALQAGFDLHRHNRLLEPDSSPIAMERTL